MNQATNTTTVNLPRTPTNTNNQNYEEETIDRVLYLYYTIRNLNPNAQYVLTLAGHNKYGKGDDVDEEILKPGANRNFFILLPFMFFSKRQFPYVSS